MNFWVVVGVMFFFEMVLLKLTESLAALPSASIMIGGLLVGGFLLNKFFPFPDSDKEN